MVSQWNTGQIILLNMFVLYWSIGPYMTICDSAEMLKFIKFIIVEIYIIRVFCEYIDAISIFYSL